MDLKNRCVIPLILGLAIICQSVSAEGSSFETELTTLCQKHYLFDSIVVGNTEPNNVSIWLSVRAWSNPNDTRSLVNQIKEFSENARRNEYEILVFGKPLLTSMIARIAVGTEGAKVDYTYDKAKRDSFAFRNSGWETVHVLQVGGLSIFKGLHVDSVFAVLTPADRVSDPDITNDGAGNMTGTHHWKKENRLIDITFKRWDGMYRVHSIRVLEGKSSTPKRSSNKTAKATATRPKSCCIYDDCKAYGGCDNYSNCFGACLDDCMRVGCPLCK